MLGGLRLGGFYAVGAVLAWWLFTSLSQAVMLLQPNQTASGYRFLWRKVWWRYPIIAIVIAWVCRYTVVEVAAFMLGTSLVFVIITSLAVWQIIKSHREAKKPTEL